MKMFAVQHKPTKKFLRFGSYASATEVATAVQASLYTRKRDADFRISEAANGRVWIGKGPTSWKDLQVMELTFSLTKVQKA